MLSPPCVCLQHQVGKFPPNTKSTSVPSASPVARTRQPSELQSSACALHSHGRQGCSLVLLTAATAAAAAAAAADSAAAVSAPADPAAPDPAAAAVAAACAPDPAVLHCHPPAALGGRGGPAQTVAAAAAVGSEAQELMCPGPGQVS
eukprot:1148305-Pelagomonas_calceolata.AAC.2